MQSEMNIQPVKQTNLLIKTVNPKGFMFPSALLWVRVCLPIWRGRTAPLRMPVWRLGALMSLFIPSLIAPASTRPLSSVSPCDAPAKPKTFPSSLWATRATWSDPEKLPWKVIVKGQTYLLTTGNSYLMLCVCFTQRAERVQWYLTVSSLRHRRRCSTTSPNCLRELSDRYASGGTAVRPSSADAPSTNAKRALPRKLGASWTDL